MAVSFAVIMVFKSSVSLQSHLFDFMESFFHRSLDRNEWQERFNGSWVCFPLIAEIKLLVLIWTGRLLYDFVKSDKGCLREGNKIDSFFGNRKLVYVLLGVTAFLFSMAVFFTPKVTSNGSGRHTGIFIVILMTGFYAVIIAFLKRSLDKYVERDNNKPSCVNKKALWAVFTLIVLVDLIWFLVFYPGVAMTDTRVVVLQGLSISSQHPWIYCLMVDLLVRVMSAAGFGYEGVFVFMSLTHILFSALVFTHCIYVLMRDQVNKYICYAVAIIYILYPMVGFYTIYLVKDILFSLIVMEWVIFLYDFMKSRGGVLTVRRDYIRLILLCVGMMLRNNGIYMMLFTLFCMLLLDICNYKKVMVIAFVLICTSALTSTVEAAGGITHNFRETVGIPIQQISAVVKYDGNMNEEEKEFINRILPVDEIKEYYNPYSVDSIKFRDDFDWEYLNGNKREFLNVWSRLLVKNLPVYVEAYSKATCGFWAVKRGYIERPDSLNYAFDREFTDSNGIRVKGILPKGLQDKLDDLMYPLTDITPGEGQLLWLVLLLGIVLMLLKGNRSFIIIAPILGGYLTMFLATPGAYCWRYVYFAALAVPFLVGLLFAKKT